MHSAESYRSEIHYKRDTVEQAEPTSQDKEDIKVAPVAEPSQAEIEFERTVLVAQIATLFNSEQL